VKKGRCFFSFDLFGVPKGFYYYASIGEKYYFSGDSAAPAAAAPHIDKNGKNVIIYSGIDINPKKILI
jgi:hypothetical protein